jgi:hypothetical protein
MRSTREREPAQGVTRDAAQSLGSALRRVAARRAGTRDRQV